MKIFYKIVVFWSVVFLAFNVFALDGIFGFAEDLFNEGDYYRAIGEYKRFIYMNKGSKLIKKAEYKIALSYLLAEKFEQAIQNFEDIEMKYPDKMKEISLLQKAYIFLKKRDYKYSLLLVDDFIKSYPESKLLDNAYYLKAWAKIYGENWKDAKEYFNKIKDSEIKKSIEMINEKLDKVNLIDQKNYFVAGILATLIPGAGHIYCGRILEGLTALLINSIFIYNTYNAFLRDDTAGKFLYGIPSTTFYLSNIYGALTAVKRYNEGEINKYIQQLEEFKIDIIIYDF
jgi:tetratricopeptide (TPR) repeat protein